MTPAGCDPSSRSPLGSAFRHVRSGLDEVERAIREQLVSESELVAAVGEHVLAAGGKRIRPALVLYAAELCGYTGARRIRIAASIELLHTATLMHDDVVDGSHLRRGRPAANALWGNRRAVLVGDFCYARASSMVVEDGDIDVLALFADTIRKMAEGEILQLQYSFDPSVSEARYYDVISRKSAALFAAACESGAIVAGATPAERRRLAEFGRELGLAFQLRDDALDYAAPERELGKPRFADLREGKVTLPLLLALERCTPAEREQIAVVLKDAARRTALGEEAFQAGDFEPVVHHVRRYGGVDDAMERADQHVARAASAIAPFPDCPAREALLAAASFSAARAS